MDHEAEPLPLSLGIVPVADESHGKALEALDLEGGPAVPPGTELEPGEGAVQAPGPPGEDRAPTSKGQAKAADPGREELEELEELEVGDNE